MDFYRKKPPETAEGIFHKIGLISYYAGKEANELIRDADSRIAQRIQTIASDLDVSSHVAKLLHEIAENCPEEPKGGFKNVAEYWKYAAAVNRVFVEEKKLYSRSKSKHPLDKEGRPFKKILIECADGRNTLTLFMEPEDYLFRFGFRWSPIAGLIIFPEIEKLESPEELRRKIQNNRELKQKLFARLDFLYKKDINAALAEGLIIDIEFQAHTGCGAHKGDLIAAQSETMKNCFITQLWLQERYSGEFKDGRFKLNRTTHEIGEGNPVYSGKWIDTKLKPEHPADLRQLQKFAEMAKQWEASPVTDNLPEGVVKPYIADPTDIEKNNHYEQIARISNHHLAHTLIGQSVLEETWSDDPEILSQHIAVLLDIMKKHYSKDNPDKPLILHFDLETGNQQMLEIYKIVKTKFHEEPGKLEIITTTTDKDTLQTEKYAQAA